MPKVNETERETQDRILKLFCDKENLNYIYAGNLHHQINKNIVENDLLAWLTSSKGGDWNEITAKKAVESVFSIMNGAYPAVIKGYVRQKVKNLV